MSETSTEEDFSSSDETNNEKSEEIAQPNFEGNWQEIQDPKNFYFEEIWMGFGNYSEPVGNIKYLSSPSEIFKHFWT